MSRTIGIDLGTTNTAIAVLVDGRPKVLEDEKGYKVLPSCVSSKGEGRYVVGLAARSLVLSSPERTVYAIKRLMGRRWDAPEVEAARERVSYDIEAGPDGGVRLRLGAEAFSPQEISAIILQVARQIAERALNEAVEEAVITVPAYFTHSQREATLEAARMAGLKCDRLLNEPTAAALAYGYRKDLDRTVVIFDLGGGTFDVCVLRISGGYYEIMATRGDSYLGGEDFDFRLVDHLADAFRAQHAVDLRRDRSSLQRLKDAAERAKCELSFTDRTTILVPRISGTTSLETVVSRATLESLVEDLVARTVETTRRALADANLGVGEIDDVILVGGQTRMPKVREAVTGLFGKEPNRSVHPEEVVAIGAAIHAASLEDGAAMEPILLDVTPFDLGIEAAGGLFTAIIKRNTKIPAARTRTFATVHDNQDRVRITVRQGEAVKAEQNEFLGEFLLDGIKPLPRMEGRVNVTFRLDANGMLHVQATEPTTGERKQITIRNYAEVAGRASEAGAVQPSVAGTAPTPAPPAAGERLASDLAPATHRKRSLLDRLFGRGQPEAAGPAGPVPAVAEAVPGEEVRDVRLVGGRPEPALAPADAEAEWPAGPSGDQEAPVGEYEDSALLPLGDEDDAGEIEDYGVVGLLRYEGQDPDTSVHLVGEEEITPATGDVLEAPPIEPFTPPIAPAAPPAAPPARPPGDGGREITDPSLGRAPDEPTEFPVPRPRPSLRPTAPPAEAPSARLSAPAVRRPARLKMNYRSLDAFAADFRTNLARGGAFVFTPTPLPTGRECLFEIVAPGLDEPLIFPGVVTWNSTAGSPAGEQGMQVEYRLDAETRDWLESVLERATRG